MNRLVYAYHRLFGPWETVCDVPATQQFLSFEPVHGYIVIKQQKGSGKKVAEFVSANYRQEVEIDWAEREAKKYNETHPAK